MPPLVLKIFSLTVTTPSKLLENSLIISVSLLSKIILSPTLGIKLLSVKY